MNTGVMKMKECCSVKTKVREKDEKDMLIDRLNRINGQVNGIKQMIEDSRYCDDVLIQIAAAASSLKSLGFAILENHMKTCLKDEIKKGNDEEIDEVLKIFNHLAR
jgi:DNA-binding FrmR family transcriptional regulator